MAQSNIEWTEESWNPIVGCSIVSPGCTNCYAMKMAHRIEGINAEARARGTSHAKQYDGTTKVVNGNAVWTGKVQLAEHILLNPLKRKKPTTYFVNSMGDLFHEDVPEEWIDRVFAVMALSPQHTFQVLTKRAARMRDYCADPERKRTIARQAMPISCSLAAAGGHAARIKLDHFSACFAGSGPFKNVWLGISAERQQEWDERKEYLRETPAAVHFASFEPLLSGIVEPRPMSDFLQWAIVGGESGPHARPMHADWARSIRDQCVAAGVPFHFKQWGQWMPGMLGGGCDTHYRILYRDGTLHEDAKEAHLNVIMPKDQRPNPDAGAHVVSRVGKKAAGRLLDGRTWDEFPNVPVTPGPA